jgi:hypothetical protein
MVWLEALEAPSAGLEDPPTLARAQIRADICAQFAVDIRMTSGRLARIRARSTSGHWSRRRSGPAARKRSRISSMRSDSAGLDGLKSARKN